MIEEGFDKKMFQADRLQAFGFVLENGEWFYRQEIMEGQFEVEIAVVPPSQVRGRIMDRELGEEYQVFRVSGAKGAFVGTVRAAYQELLEKVADQCSTETVFTSEQGLRLEKQMQRHFSDRPVRPFTKHPGISAYCNPVNGKWYALVLSVQREKLDLQGEKWSQEEKGQSIQVLNLKVPPIQMDSLLQVSGIYPSYHMNKRHWISVVLDDCLADECLFDLVARSRELTFPRGHRSVAGPDYWVIPANPKVFDIDQEFAQTDEVYWTQKSSIQAGDLVCMYVTAPVQELRYVCLVLEDHIPPEQIPEETSDKPLMKVRRIHTFEAGEFSRERLGSLGIRAVRGPRRLTQEMIEAVKRSLHVQVGE